MSTSPRSTALSLFETIRPILLGLGLVIAIIAQLYAPAIDEIRAQLTSSTFLWLNGIAIVLAALGWARPDYSWGTPPPVGCGAAPRISRPRGLAGAALASGITLVLVLRLRGNNGDPTTLILWVAAMVLLAASFLSSNDIRSGINWLGSHRWDLAIVAALSVAAIPVYLINLGGIPWRIQSDETAMAANAVAFGTSQPPSVFALGWLGHPTLFFYIQYLAAQTFGWGIASIRVPAALCGWLMVPIVYGLTRSLFGRIAGVVAGILALTSVAQITYARLALNNAPSELAYTLTFLFLAVVLRSRRMWPASLAGIAAGFGFYLYFGSRMLPLVGAGVLIVLLVAQPRWRAIRVRQLGVYGLSVALTILPQAFDVARQPEPYLSRFLNLAVNQTTPGQAAVPELFRSLATNALQSFLVLYHVPDLSIFFYDGRRPLLDNLLGPLIVLGISLTLSRPDDPRMFLASAWFWPNWIAGGVFLVGAPYSPRIVCVISLVIVLVGVVATQVARDLAQFVNLPAGRVIIQSFPLAFVLLVSFREVSSYLSVWQSFYHDDPHTQVTRWQLDHGPRAYVAVEGGGIPPTVEYPAAVFGDAKTNFTTWPASELAQLRSHSTITFYFEHPTDNTKFIGVVRRDFPGGQLVTLSGANGDAYYTIFDTRVPEILPTEAGSTQTPAGSLTTESIEGLPMTALHVIRVLGLQDVESSGKSSNLTGIAFGPGGEFAVADPGAHVVRIYGADGREMRHLANATLIAPSHVVQSPLGDLLVEDSESPVVLQRFGWDGASKGEVQVGSGYYRPFGIAIGEDGALLLSDTGSRRLVWVAPDGKVMPRALRPEEGWGQGSPVAPGIGVNGATYVLSSDGRLARIDEFGLLSASVITSDPGPNPSILVDGNQVLATWPSRGELIAFDSTTLRPTSALRLQTASASVPTGLARAPDGSIAVLDSARRTVLFLH